MTCLESGFPCKGAPVRFCGDGTCRFDDGETASNCAADCFDNRAAVDNHCAQPLPAEVDRLDLSSGGLFKVWNDGGTATAESVWEYLDSKSRSPCHVQGFARLRKDNGFAFVANRTGGKGKLVWPFTRNCSDENSSAWSGQATAYVWTGKITSASGGEGCYAPNNTRSQDQVTSFLRLGNNPSFFHPGGVQAIGDFLVVGVDRGQDFPSWIYLVNVRDPDNPFVVWRFTQLFDRAEAVAIGRTAAGDYLLFVGAHQGDVLNVWRSTTTNLQTTGWSFDYQFSNFIYGGYTGPSKDYNYNNLAALRECGSNDLYLAGLTSNGSKGGTVDSQDDSVIELWSLNGDGSQLGAMSLATTVTLDNPCNGFLQFDICPNFGAGGTIYVNEQGFLLAYASEHYPDGNDLDILEWKSRICKANNSLCSTNSQCCSGTCHLFFPSSGICI